MKKWIIACVLSFVLFGCVSSGVKQDLGDKAYDIGKYAATAYILRSDGINEENRKTVEVIYSAFKRIVDRDSEVDLDHLKPIIKEQLENVVEDESQRQQAYIVSMVFLEKLIKATDKAELENTSGSEVFKKFIDGIESALELSKEDVTVR